MHSVATADPSDAFTTRARRAGERSQQTLLDDLVSARLISHESAGRAAVLTRELGLHALPGLLRLNAIAELPLYRFYADWLGLPLIERDDHRAEEIRSSAIRLMSDLHVATAWAEARGLLLFERDGQCHAAVREEVAVQVAEVLARKAAQRGISFEWAVVTPSMYDLLRPRPRDQHPDGLTAASDDLKTLRELAEEGPTIELVNTILSRAVTQRASDVHIEPGELNFAVRVRVDGEMLQQSIQPRDRFDAVACRVKILASLDIAERRLPQDGRINARVNGESFDIRVSVLPGSAGESIVLRLLRQERKPTQLQDLGMRAAQAATFEDWSRHPNGIVLVTGPTGSGKSTTLYTALELADDRTKKIITVEDPVEYKIPGITQLQVNADIGFTFATALRSILRHDPDVILVGEIRDEETARIAIQSALTGHLVFSTLHTNSAIGAVTRLVDMGIEPFLISASVRGLMAQRLVRKLCPHCSVPDEEHDAATEALIGSWLSAHPGSRIALRRPVGCVQCSGTGFLGRVAIYELIDVDHTMAALIARGAGEADLLRHLGRSKDDGLLQAGVGHVADGITTIGELVRAAG